MGIEPLPDSEKWLRCPQGFKAPLQGQKKPADLQSKFPITKGKASIVPGMQICHICAPLRHFSAWGPYNLAHLLTTLLSVLLSGTVKAMGHEPPSPMKHQTSTPFPVLDILPSFLSFFSVPSASKKKKMQLSEWREGWMTMIKQKHSRMLMVKSRWWVMGIHCKILSILPYVGYFS